MSIMFDLNNLKRANDTYGHAVGDQLITNFARLLRNAIPAKDFVGRGMAVMSLLQLLHRRQRKKSLIS